MPRPSRSGRFVGVVVVALWVSGFGAAAQQPVIRDLDLGRFKLAAFEGLVRLDGRSNKVSVILGVQHTVEGQQVPADEFQAWLLLKDGKSLALLERSPAKGQKPLAFRGGGEQSILSFSFESGSPVALVLGVGTQFQVFPITSEIPR